MCNSGCTGTVGEGLADNAAVCHDALFHSRVGLTIKD